MLANTAYDSANSAVVIGLAMGYTSRSKRKIRGANLKFDFTSGYNVGMAVIDVGLILATKDKFIKQGIVPADILK